MKQFLLDLRDEIRETRTRDNTEDKVLLFVCLFLTLLLILGGAFLVIALFYTFPVPVSIITFTVWALWKMYNRI